MNDLCATTDRATALSAEQIAAVVEQASAIPFATGSLVDPAQLRHIQRLVAPRPDRMGRSGAGPADPPRLAAVLVRAGRARPRPRRRAQPTPAAEADRAARDRSGCGRARPAVA